MHDDRAPEPEAAVTDQTERSWLSRLGPGLVTGAADDDPSGIGTYSQAGAQFGYTLLWTLLLTYPLMVAIQMTSASIGRVTGKGLASNMRGFGPKWLVIILVLLLAIANTINIAADLGAMAAAIHLLVPGPVQLYIVAIGVLSGVLQIWLPYESYARFLKWMTLVLLAYVAVAFVAPVDWGKVAVSVAWPRAHVSGDYLTMVVAVLGTTISPYLFFWQVSSFRAYRQIDRITADTWIGMAVSNGVGFFIMLTAAATLYAHHAKIQTSADAAKALEPIAGHLAAFVFAAGIVGTGLLALPVLAGSAAYGAAGTFRWRSSLSLQSDARARVLFGHRHCNSRRNRDHLLPPRSDQGTLLECGHQRTGCRTCHGGGHVDGLQPAGDGQVRDLGPAEGGRVVSDCPDGRRCRRHVHSWLAK
ncbi:membrane protein of unknown function (plasmid) [Pararobbsia alpina]